jgi:hypothetical protein
MTNTVLRLDAIASGAIGLLLLAAAPFVADHLGPPTALSRTIGAFLVAWAVAVAAVAQRPTRRAVQVVIGVNLAWTVASVVYAFADDRLTTLGVTFTLLQAAAVLGFAALQTVGLKPQAAAVR